MFLKSSIKMLVCDMAGTTINENGIVYKTLYNCIKKVNDKINMKDMNKYHGYNKTEVMEYYLNQTDIIDKNKTFEMMKQEFTDTLEHEYKYNPEIELIHPTLPDFFNDLRKDNIKICLNTGYNKHIQKILIDKFNMNEYIDDYISSEEVMRGRPYPCMIKTLMLRNQIYNPMTIIKIGDTCIDIQEGKNMNCLTVGVLSGADSKVHLMKHNPTFIVDNIIDIKVS